MDSQPLPVLPASLFDGNPDAIAVYDREGRCMSANPAALQISGYTLDQLVGSHYREHVHARDRERVEEAFRSALAGFTEHFESTIRDRSGVTVPIDVFLFPARVDGAIAGVFAQARDAVALRSAEQSLALNQERFRSLFEYHPDAIMSLKFNGAISRVNVALEAATGFYGEQLIAKPWTEIIAPEHREQADDAFRLVHRGEAVEFDSLLLDRVGNRIDVQMKLVPLRVADAIEGAYAVAKNVMAQREAERAIALQGERIRQLYLVAAARGDSIEVQIDNTLTLGCRLFGFDYGYVARCDNGTIAIVNAVGDSGVHRGAVFPKEEPPWQADPAFTAKLVVNNAEYGSLVFAGREPHSSSIPDLDRDLLQLMALFVAAALERAAHAERIQQLAFYDALTGLPNRVLFADRIAQALAAAKRYNRGFSVMYLDLDAFKEINDRYGHPVGDLVLRAVAERLILTLRDSDTIARFGGDEFVILQPVVNGAADASDLARKIIADMQAPFTIEGAEHVVHTSIGIALFPQDALTSEELMERADRALYRAKRAGRNRWVFFADEAATMRRP